MLAEYQQEDFFISFGLMKRFITIAICIVFFGYLLVILSAFGLFRQVRYVPFKATIKQVGSFIGFRSLFIKETSLQSSITSYRFYQDGKWQGWKQLEAPLFEEYIAMGRIASLKHNRLDRHLSQQMVRVGLQSGNAKMINSKPFKAFTSHLFFRHNHNRKPDSIEILFERKPNGSLPLTNTRFNFKCKP